MLQGGNYIVLFVPLFGIAMSLDGLVLQHDRLGQLRLPLLGRHQAANAAIALGAIAVLLVIIFTHDPVMRYEQDPYKLRPEVDPVFDQVAQYIGLGEDSRQPLAVEHRHLRDTVLLE